MKERLEGLLKEHVPAIVESIETELLGRQALSFKLAAKRENWMPEDSTSVCWRCAGEVGAYETDGDGCASCRANKLAWDRAIRLGRYDGIIGDAVRDLKFRRWIKTGMEVGCAMGHEIAGRLEAMQMSPDEVVIVPIPMTNRRRIARGVDHTQVLARGVSKVTGIRVVRLLKARNRAEQVGLSATDRAKNIRGAFYVPGAMNIRMNRENGILKGVRAVIILDDVRTTGSTLSEGCKVVRKLFLRSQGRNLDKFEGHEVEIWAGCLGFAGEERKGGTL